MRLAIALTLLSSPLAAQTCGGSFTDFREGLRSEALQRGIPASVADAFLDAVRLDDSVIAADRRQGFFQKDFIDFTQSVISANRLNNGAANASRYADTFAEIEARYGVPRGVLLAFWALETDYGAVQGDFDTADALVTLAHDCRRPELFRPQIFAAMELMERGDFSMDTKGAWAGEIGQVQMLPEDILNYGTDGDGDGKVTIKTSTPDALHSAARMLVGLGWQAKQPWLQEVEVPSTLNWAETGLTTRRPASDWAALGVTPRNGSFQSDTLDAALLLPMGRNGPAFLAYPNFDVYFEWNQSFTYVLTAAYMATRLSGADRYDAGTPEAGLTGEQMQRLQQALQARGYDVGGADGILGEMTRRAVRAEQLRLGLPADAWPTRALLDAL